MHYESSSDDIVLSSVDLDQMILNFIGSVSFSISLNISEISNVSHCISGSTMSETSRVVMSTSSDASIGKVTELVDVESVLAWG